MAFPKIRDFGSTTTRSSKTTGARINRPDCNQTVLQGFEWYLPGFTIKTLRERGLYIDQKVSHWRRLIDLLPQISDLGFTSVWIPPACKATNPNDVGYGVYDLYDLGEFDTKGSVGTKWGTKDELQAFCSQAKQLNIDIIFDAVLNHKAAADASEEALAVRVNPRNRTQELDQQPRIVRTWTRFDFGARRGKYSTLMYTKDHFSGIDWDDNAKEKAIFKFVGQRPNGSNKGWAVDVARKENGNYDYLMFADVDFDHPQVREDVKQWGCWLLDQLPGVTGFRLDAIKHYSAGFQKEFIDCIQDHADRKGQKIWFVGEFWLSNSKGLSNHINNTFGGKINLFDVKLVYNFHDMSQGRLHDIRRIFDDTLVQYNPNRAVTFVTNHDTQEMQSLAAPIEPWFIPHAYALILLRKAGHPCVFWGDILGNAGPRPRLPTCGGRLVRLIKARELYAYGEQMDFYPEIGCKTVTPKHDAELFTWVRTWTSPMHGKIGLVVLVSISWGFRKKRVIVSPECAGQIFTDLMGWSWSGVEINKSGIGEFPVGPRSISVWTWRDAPGRSEIDNLVWPDQVPADVEISRNMNELVDNAIGQAVMEGL